MRDSIGPVACLSMNCAGNFRYLSKTSRRKELITLRPIQPSDASEAKPAVPRAMKMPMNANGIHRDVSRLCWTSVSSMSGSTRYTMVASMTAAAAIDTMATSPTSLCGMTYRQSRE